MKCQVTRLRIRAECHSKCHPPQVRYSVLRSKNLHDLEEVFTFGPDLLLCALLAAASTG